MNPISRMIMSCRNMCTLFSGKSTINCSNPVYQPNKGRTKIWVDHLREILTTGAIERGYWMYGFYNMTYKQQMSYEPYASFMIKRNELNMHPKTTFVNKEHFNYLCILRDKFVFGRFLQDLGFPVAKDIMLIDGASKTIRLLGDDKSVLPLAQITDYSFDAFCKIVSGECGKGVFKLSCTNGKLHGDVSELGKLEHLIGDSLFVLQQRLTQHPIMSEMYGLSINTIRLITCMDRDGVITAMPAVVRFGANGNVVDNWAAGGVLVGIDDEGILFGNGKYEFPINGVIELQRHPDSGRFFRGFRIPYYKEAVQLAKELHSNLYGIPCIGWDIAITNEGPVFIEGNDNFELSLMQTVHGGLKDVWRNAIASR